MTPSLLATSRLRLRAMEPSDALMMYEVENDPEVWFYSSRVAPLSMHAISRYANETTSDPIREKQLRLVIELADEQPCGLVDLYEINPIDRTALVGIIILADYRRLGYASEALTLLDRYARTALRLRALAARIASTNEGSLHLFAGAGYRSVGVMPDWILSPQGAVDMAIYWRSLEK